MIASAVELDPTLAINHIKVWPRHPAVVSVDLKAPVGTQDDQRAKKQKLDDLLDRQPVFLPDFQMVAACSPQQCMT